MRRRLGLAGDYAMLGLIKFVRWAGSWRWDADQEWELNAAERLTRWTMAQRKAMK